MILSASNLFMPKSALPLSDKEIHASYFLFHQRHPASGQKQGSQVMPLLSFWRAGGGTHRNSGGVLTSSEKTEVPGLGGCAWQLASLLK